MNPLHELPAKTTCQLRGRNGLSIIEVLTSIVVAMIGVFGVMILIPFAVKQAQIGLDSDAATLLGRNAYSNFEIAGYRLPENWAVYRDSSVGMSAYSPFENRDADGDGVPDSKPDPPQVFSIDPLGFLENGGGNLEQQFENAIFPYNRRNVGATEYPINLLIAPASLGTPAGPMGIAVARRMFRSSDDLIFGEATDELLGPEQAFDVGDSGTLRRQSNGKLSWSAIVVPFKDDPTLMDTRRWSYKMYILVYKDRTILIDPMPEPEDQMATIQVTNTGPANPISTVFLESGGTPVVVQGAVNRDDWVMLINRDSAAEPGFEHQLAFYRVVNVSDESPSVAANMTLDGPPFVFATSDPTNTIGPTYAVHLQDVVSVFEKTFSPESESNWNITY